MNLSSSMNELQLRKNFEASLTSHDQNKTLNVEKEFNIHKPTQFKK